MSKISVAVKLLGHLMWYPDQKQKQHKLQVKEGTTIKELLEELKVPIAEVNYVSKNGQRADLNATLNDGDWVEVIPTIGGG
jgi:sulfur carrier protein/molybdopterin synthase sulfur carrier subunit